MTFLQAIILSIVDGITEFLPISSTGHLILVSHIMQIPETDFVKSFEIIIQLGAILAIVALYWKRLLDIKRTWFNVILAFIPTGIIGLVLYKFIKTYLLGNDLVTVTSLFLGGILLIAIENIYKRANKQGSSVEKLSKSRIFSIGLFQSLSVIPGVSRSAATILGGMFLGLSRQSAVEFSFFLAIPTMLAATGLDVLKMNASFSGQEVILIITGFIGSFLTALAVVKLFVKFIQSHTFIAFGVYRILISLLYLLVFVIH